MNRDTITPRSAAKYTWLGVAIGLAIAAIAMVSYCVVLVLPLEPGQSTQTGGGNAERIGDVALFGVVVFVLTWAPTAAAFGGAAGVIAYLVRPQRTPLDRCNDD